MEVEHLAGSAIVASVSASAFEITLVGESGISASINPADGNDLGDVFGVNPRGTKDGYVYNYFEKASADEFTVDKHKYLLLH